MAYGALKNLRGFPVKHNEQCEIEQGCESGCVFDETETCFECGRPVNQEDIDHWQMVRILLTDEQCELERESGPKPRLLESKPNNLS